jgi:hypothetical protein
LVEIGKTLKGTTAFRDQNDLAQFLSDGLGSALQAQATSDKLDMAQLTAYVIERFNSPLQTFSFCAPLSLNEGLSISFRVGGLHGLVVSFNDTNENRMLASGQVEAATEPAAITAVDEIVAALLGVFHILGLCITIAPLPGARHSVLLTITPHEDNIPLELSSDIAAGIAGTVFRLPSDATELERKLIKDGQVEKGLERKMRQLVRVMASTDDHAKKLRRAAALHMKATVTREIELAIAYSFMCLEGILLDANVQDNVISRLIEAVAYRIGTSPSHRTQLRKEVRELYNIRSRYVHAGTPGDLGLTDVRRRCLMIVEEVLSREIQDLGV